MRNTLKEVPREKYVTFSDCNYKALILNLYSIMDCFMVLDYYIIDLLSSWGYIGYDPKSKLTIIMVIQAIILYFIVINHYNTYSFYHCRMDTFFNFYTHSLSYIYKQLVWMWRLSLLPSFSSYTCFSHACFFLNFFFLFSIFFQP